MTAAARMAGALEAIWARVGPEVIARLDSLEEAVGSLLGGGVPEDLRARAERDAHKLAGSAGTFGYRRSSELARELEQALSGPELRLEDAGWMAEHVMAMRAELEAGGGAQALTAAQDGERPLVLVVDDGPEAAERLAPEAETRGLQLASASRAAARREAAARLPAAVLLGTGSGVDEETLALIADLAGGPPPVPVLVSGGGEALADRVAVARAGGRAVLSRGMTARRIADALGRAVAEARTVRARVLALDDDPAALDALASLLDGVGIGCVGVGDADAFWERLADDPPDLAILDVDLPGTDGIELCQAIRTDPALAQLPILMLTARDDAETLQRAFAAGADDYVPKPVVGPVLLTRISSRLERVRLYRELAQRDPLTGLANREASEAAFQRLIDTARGSDDPLTLAVVDMDRFKRLNDGFGHAAGDLVLRGFADVLRTTFRAEDVVARWGGEEFVIGMYGMPATSAVARLEGALERLRVEGVPGAGEAGRDVSFSAGVAERGLHGDDLTALYRAADLALFRAKAAGRARALIAGEHATAERVDVVVVEDDEALAEILRHALRTAGLTVRWLADGETARSLLGGAEPRLSGRLLVLDVDLPALDGLALLRALRRDGVLQRTRALMLTARAAEGEILAALELGAVDHVAKPFSVPILMQRVRRALGD